MAYVQICPPAEPNVDSIVSYGSTCYPYLLKEQPIKKHLLPYSNALILKLEAVSLSMGVDGKIGHQRYFLPLSVPPTGHNATVDAKLVRETIFVMRVLLTGSGR